MRRTCGRILAVGALISCAPLLIILWGYDDAGPSGLMRADGSLVIPGRNIDDSHAAQTGFKNISHAVEATSSRAGVQSSANTSSDGGRALKSNSKTNYLYIAFEYDAARLGNKLFQYASTVGIAHRHGLPLLAVVNSPQKRYYYHLMQSLFRISVASIDNDIRQSVSWISEAGFAIYDRRTEDPSLFEESSVSFSGFLQSWKYFEGAEGAVRKEFTLTEAFERSAADALNKFSQSLPFNASTFVGVHVRRGDMAFNTQRYHVASEGYVISALKLYETKYGATTLYVVATDDEWWVRQTVSALPELNARIVFTRGTAEMDLAILSKCNHSIITCGSYGWWAGWLAGGEVVYYSDYVTPSSDIANQFSPTDYYPPRWIGMK